MKHHATALLVSAFFALDAGAEPVQILDIDFASTSLDARGTLVVPNGTKAQATAGEVAFVAKTRDGSSYTMKDIAAEGGMAFLRSRPERNAFLEAVLPESVAPGREDFSVAFWFRPSAEEAATGFLLLSGTSQPAWRIFSTDNDAVSVAFNGQIEGRGVLQASRGTLKPGAWNHIAVVFDRSESFSIYLNGKLDSTSASISSHSDSMPGRVFLGGPHQYASGDFGPVQIFRGKLSEEQVENLAGERVSSN